MTDIITNGLNIFSASWCQPCKMLKAKLDSEGITYNMIDVDEQAVLASSYNVRGVPTCIYLQDGFEKERFVGADSFKSIIELNNKL